MRACCCTFYGGGQEQPLYQIAETDEVGDRMTGIFFDIDDTLYSRRSLLLQAAGDTLAETGGGAKLPDASRFMDAFYAFSDDNFPRIMSGEITPWQSNVERYVRTLRHLGLNADDADGEVFADRYEWLQNHLTLSHPLQELLQELSTCPAVRLGVITNGTCDRQGKKFRMLGLDRYIAPERLIVSGEIGVSKPDPVIFRAAEERIGLRPESLWMVGDSYRADIRGAKDCGWHTLWINCNGEKPDGADSDLTVCSEEELCRAVRNLAGIAGSAQ